MLGKLHGEKVLSNVGWVVFLPVSLVSPLDRIDLVINSLRDVLAPLVDSVGPLDGPRVLELHHLVSVLIAGGTDVGPVLWVLFSPNRLLVREVVVIDDGERRVEIVI